MDRDELLSNYVDAFKRKRQEIAKAIDASFISGKLHKIRTFPDDELDILADLIPPEQNVNCVQLLRDAKDLDRFSKFSAALSPDKREKLFPFVRDAPPALHPSYRTWELRIMRHRAEKPTHLLVLTTNRREFEFAVKWSSVYPPVNAKETEELWGEVKIFVSVYLVLCSCSVCVCVRVYILYICTYVYSILSWVCVCLYVTQSCVCSTACVRIKAGLE